MNKKRQTITRPLDGPGFIAPAQPVRDRSWERSNPTVSYRLPLRLRDEITRRASQMGVSTSDLCWSLLEYALANIEEIEFDKRLVTGRFTLH